MPSALCVLPALRSWLGSVSPLWRTSITAWIATRTLWPRSVLDARTPSLGLVKAPVWWPMKDNPGTTTASTAKNAP
uniref:Secreted protein n=1 Tax=Molossus molossus TaxID=27622 RepID=A0A7J8J593_MOLMO|nr:hypothetical protein HJG59_005167 [Molossus molossus]